MSVHFRASKLCDCDKHLDNNITKLMEMIQSKGIKHTVHEDDTNVTRICDRQPQTGSSSQAASAAGRIRFSSGSNIRNNNCVYALLEPLS